MDLTREGLLLSDRALYLSFSFLTVNVWLYLFESRNPSGPTFLSWSLKRITKATDIQSVRVAFNGKILLTLYQTTKCWVEPHSSVGSVADMRMGGRWFNPHLVQYSFRGLMIIIATGFIPLSPLSVVLTMVIWESSQWLGKNIVWSIS